MSGPGHAVVAGARSQIGIFLLPRLVERGYRVTALSRAPAQPGSPPMQLTWCAPDAAPATAENLVSCGPLRLACERVERGGGLQRVVAFSTTSTISKQQSRDRAEREQVTAIAEEEDRLKTLCRERDIALHILRPTLVYGCGLDRNLSRLLRFGERTGFIPISTHADGLRQPVHAEDLAAAALRALQHGGGDFFESAVCGGSTLAYRHMLDRTARCGSRSIRLFPLHPNLMIALVKAARLAGLASGVNAEMVRRQAIDLVFDDTPARETLGWNPRPFEPTPADFAIPYQEFKGSE